MYVILNVINVPLGLELIAAVVIHHMSYLHCKNVVIIDVLPVTIKLFLYKF